MYFHCLFSYGGSFFPELIDVCVYDQVGQQLYIVTSITSRMKKIVII